MRYIRFDVEEHDEYNDGIHNDVMAICKTNKELRDFLRFLYRRYCEEDIFNEYKEV